MFTPNRLRNAVIASTMVVGTLALASCAQAEAPRVKKCYMFEVGDLSDNISGAGITLLKSYIGVTNIEGYTGLDTTSSALIETLGQQRTDAQSKTEIGVLASDIVTMCVNYDPNNVNSGGEISAGVFTKFVDKVSATPERFVTMQLAHKGQAVFVVPEKAQEGHTVATVPVDEIIYKKVPSISPRS